MICLSRVVIENARLRMAQPRRFPFGEMYKRLNH